MSIIVNALCEELPRGPKSPRRKERFSPVPSEKLGSICLFHPIDSPNCSRPDGPREIQELELLFRV